MGLTRWLISKGLFYLFIFAIFYLIGELLGIVPEPLKNLVKWVAGNFLLITILLISFMGFLVMMRLTGPKRSQTT